MKTDVEHTETRNGLMEGENFSAQRSVYILCSIEEAQGGTVSTTRTLCLVGKSNLEQKKLENIYTE